MVDVPLQNAEILALIDKGIAPQSLIDTLCAKYSKDNVIEALQRAIENEKITLDANGMVVVVGQFAEAA